MIDFSLTPEQKELREQIIDFSKKNLNQDVDGRDERGEFQLDLWKKCGELQLQGLGVPKEYGGRGLDARSTCVALEAFGYGSRDSGLNFALSAHLLACVMPIVEFGSPLQKEQWLPSLSDGSSVATNAMTEETPGSDAYAMASTAEAKGTGYLLNGTKTYCSNGPVSDTVLTYAVTDKNKGTFGGISAFVLHENVHSYEKTPAEHKLGLRTTQMGMIIMKDTEVSEEYMLGKKGAGTVIFNRSMEWERICLGAIHLGDMEFLLEHVTAYVNNRKLMNGASIASFQSISHKMAELKTRLEAARLMIWKAAWMLDNGKSVIQQAAMTKNYVSQLYKDMCVELGQICGGYTFRGRHDLERSLRHSIGATVYSGTTEVQNEIIAKTMRLK